LTTHVVTGGAGFIGSHIVEALAGRGDRVIVLDDLSTGRAENLAGIAGEVDLREVDLAGAEGLETELGGVDTVFHQAAIPSVPFSLDDPLRSHRANVDATLRLLIGCRAAGVRRVVYASSCALYGDSPELPKREDMAAAPVSPYGAQKYFSELYMQVFWRSWGLETVSLRYFNVFGPRQDAGSPYSGVIARFIPAVLAGNRPVVYGDGQQSRDFVYVSNVVEANLRASQVKGIGGEVFNIAPGLGTSVSETLGEILDITGARVAPVYRPARPGDILHSRADATLARERLGWSPAVSFRDGLRRTIDWYRETPGTASIT
jgi:UDP-N-acetylglucosamine/UDP-N-acetyl-alpha-D-glucosaminouronate 4-epimerase